MIVVIDASIALKWVLDEADAQAADALLDEELIAPALWLVEAANALWRRVTRGKLTAEEAQARLEQLGDAPRDIVSGRTLYRNRAPARGTSPAPGL